LVEFDGNRIWYQRQGSGHPIVPLHHADHRLWDLQVAQFRRYYDVIVPDLIGFGQSDRPERVRNVGFVRIEFAERVALPRTRCRQRASRLQ
jgi:pimeloyl-ACP methyl ester carboxylesterase